MALAFAFFCFLFYRIMSSAMFADPLTIWASALSAVTTTIIVVLSAPLGIAWAYNEIDDGPKRLRIARLAMALVAAAAVSCLSCYLIALGFSDRLYQDLSYWSSRRTLLEQDLFWFCVMISIPVVVHMMVVFRFASGIR
jgi:hypothetical protein